MISSPYATFKADKSMDQFNWIVWCDDGSGYVFNIAVCKSEAEALSTRGLAAAISPDKTFTITKESQS